MNKNIENVLRQVQEVSGYLWQRGWAERNGGNISVNVTEECINDFAVVDENYYVDFPGLPIKLAGCCFFCSGTGLRIRDLAKGIEELKENSCILKINKDASGYNIVWGGEREKFRPTSEFISHLSIHLDLMERNTGYKAVVHTHPYDLISLSHSEKYCIDSEQVSDVLWKMLPEVRVFVPRGIGLVPYALPGSKKLAELTVEALKGYDVALWEKHGALAVGRDVVEAFDFIDVANKGAELFLKCLSAGYVPEGLSDRQIKELEDAYLY